MDSAHRNAHDGVLGGIRAAETLGRKTLSKYQSLEELSYNLTASVSDRRRERMVDPSGACGTSSASVSTQLFAARENDSKRRRAGAALCDSPSPVMSAAAPRLSHGAAGVLLAHGDEGNDV